MSEVSTTEGRNFSITLGLKAGYADDGELFEPEAVLPCWKRWAYERHRARKPYLGIKLSTEAEVIAYAFEREGSLVFYSEPVASIRGEITSYHEHLSDEEVVETLTSLAEYLGKEFKQTTVRFLYHGKESFRQSYRVRLPDTEHPLD